jgi:hypothetical protein
VVSRQAVMRWMILDGSAEVIPALLIMDLLHLDMVDFGGTV